MDLKIRIQMILSFAMLALLASSTLPRLVPETSAQTVVTGPFVDQITFSQTMDEAQGLADVSAGRTDVYLWRLPIALREQAKSDPNITLVKGMSSFLSIVLNPAPTEALNPFSLKCIRQALQYLIDRAYIIKVIHKGDAVPKILAYGRSDPDYDDIDDLAETWLAEYNYNFDKASQLIAEALTAVGAIRGEDGKWYKNGSPITVNGFIRSDDPIRKSIGDMLATNLENIGFTVNRVYGDLNGAFFTVYGSDPIEGQWHFYTESFLSDALVKYDIAGLVQMYCPFLGNMPGWQEPDCWNYENATLDELGQGFMEGHFSDLSDRAFMTRQIVKIAFEESVRLFLVDQIGPYLVSSRFPPFVTEAHVGPRTPFTFTTIRLPDEDPSRRPDGTGGSLKVAQRFMYQGAYNPIAGFTDTYSGAIRNIIMDSGVWPHPYKGDYMPVRADYTVQTSGYYSMLSVPEDAETWDFLNHQWQDVGQGRQAKSKITFTFKLSNWHHGQPMTVADTRYALYMMLEWATRGLEGVADLRYDSYYAGLLSTWVDNFVGAKFIGNDKVEVYVDYWFPDDNQIAAFANLFPQVPWEVLLTAERVVMAKQAAWSRAEARAIDKPWLDLVAPAAGLPEMKANLAQIMAGNLLPDAAKNATTGMPLAYFDAANRTRRYNALQDWVNQKNHFLVSNGPFYFESTDRISGQDVVKAFRDPTYPFEPGYWLERLRTHADFSYTPFQPTENQPITFNASASFDLIEDIEKYAWNFGDGATATEASPVITHAYTEPGTYAVELTATSSSGQTDRVVKSVKVYAPPTVSFQWTPEKPVVNEAVSFTAVASDPDGWIVNYKWDFGDETYASGSTVEHSYSHQGIYVISLTVIDNDDLTAAAQATISVRPPIAISITPSEGIVGTQVMVTGSDAVPDSDLSIFWGSYVPEQWWWRVDYILIGTTTADINGEFTFTFELPPSTLGTHWVKAADMTTQNFDQKPLRVLPHITVKPSSGAVGTKITVNGTGFPYPYSSSLGTTISFDDQLLGFGASDLDGNMQATLNAPLASAGAHLVKALMWGSDPYSGVSQYYASEAAFIIIDTTPLGVMAEVGAIFFKGETAMFYIQTAFKGIPTDATSMDVKLQKPDGSTESLTLQWMATGTYQTSYQISGKGSMQGTYALIVEASYTTESIQTYGTATKTFLVKPTWERELPRMATLSIAAFGLIGVMLVLWHKEKKRLV